MKQMRIAESKCNSLAPCSGKEANGKIEYGKNLMKHRKIYLAVSIGCLLMAAIDYQIESHFLINTNPFFYCALPALIIGLCVGHRLFLSSIECNIQSSVKDFVFSYFIGNCSYGALLNERCPPVGGHTKRTVVV